ncbi:MAG: MFS transporter [Deltaproteobacteria bacterium]|nr:MFS transporter [Deltaproteobacteria bacterium]MBW1930368.1 MFS transporter [Deltaproteobacteria bacterium]MBW2126138.1 MFS transporter [Deltaproteobacteria bacterium]
MNNSTTLWDKRFVLINIIFFLIFSNISFFYLYPLALQAMGSEDYLIGLVMGLFSVATVISRPFMGKLAASQGEQRLILWGIGAILVASVSYAFEQSFGPAVILTRIFHGVGFSAFISGSFSIVAKVFPSARRAQAYAVVGAALMSASALAPPFGEIIINRSGFTLLYLAASLAALIALALMAMMRSTLGTGGPLQQARPAGYITMIKDSSLCCLLLSTLIFAHCQSTVVNFLALIAQAKGTLSGRFFLTAFAVAIFLLLGFGKAIDRFGKRRFLRLSYPLLVAGLFLIPSMLEANIFFVPAGLFGVAMGLLFPAHNALAADHGSKEEKAGVMSLFTAVYDTGFITGAVLSGWMAQTLGLDHLFSLTSLIALSGFILVLFSPIRDK